MVTIEDELHAEVQGEFAGVREALAELKRRAGIRWDDEPNRAPCISWETCGRTYEIVEYDDAQSELRRYTVLRISSSGVEWSAGFAEVGA
jgi:hypothetical protein